MLSHFLCRLLCDYFVFLLSCLCSLHPCKIDLFPCALLPSSLLFSPPVCVVHMHSIRPLQQVSAMLTMRFDSLLRIMRCYDNLLKRNGLALPYLFSRDLPLCAIVCCCSSCSFVCISLITPPSSVLPTPHLLFLARSRLDVSVICRSNIAALFALSAASSLHCRVFTCSPRCSCSFVVLFCVYSFSLCSPMVAFSFSSFLHVVLCSLICPSNIAAGFPPVDVSSFHCCFVCCFPF